MGEDNLEKRAKLADMSVLFSNGVVIGEITDANIDLAEGESLTTYSAFKNIEGAEFSVKIDPAIFDFQSYRRLILGLPAVPIQKERFHKKTMKKALMACGYSRNQADKLCKTVAEAKGKYRYPRWGDSTWMFLWC